jgi:hypothetical protein
LKVISCESIADVISYENFTDILEDIPFIYKNHRLIKAVSLVLANYITDGYNEQVLKRFIAKYSEFSYTILIGWIKNFKYSSYHYSSDDDSDSSDSSDSHYERI